MDTRSQSSDSPDMAYGITLIAQAPTAPPKLSATEKARVAQWAQEATAALRDAGAGVPTHCSKVIIELCRLVRQLSGEGPHA